MTDLKITFTRTIQTGIMIFIPENEDQYHIVESKMIEEFAEQPFGNTVAFNVGDEDFFQYWLSADVEDEVDFFAAIDWVRDRMKEHGATLDSVS